MIDCEFDTLILSLVLIWIFYVFNFNLQLSKLYIIIKSRITAAAVHKGTGSQTSNSASMVTIYEMTKDINDGYGTPHIDVNGNPEFYILIPAT